MSLHNTQHSPEAGPESKNLFRLNKQVLLRLIIPILVTKRGHCFLQGIFSWSCSCVLSCIAVLLFELLSHACLLITWVRCVAEKHADTDWRVGKIQSVLGSGRFQDQDWERLELENICIHYSHCSLSEIKGITHCTFPSLGWYRRECNVVPYMHPSFTSKMCLMQNWILSTVDVMLNPVPGDVPSCRFHLIFVLHTTFT